MFGKNQKKKEEEAAVLLSQEKRNKEGFVPNNHSNLMLIKL